MAVVKGRIIAVNSRLRVPENPEKWSLGVYSDSRRVLSVEPKLMSKAPAWLNKGEVLEFEAEIPVDRLLLYYTSGQKLEVQGPFAAGPHRFPIKSVVIQIEEPVKEKKLWAQTRPPDKGSIPGKYVPGDLMVQFNQGISLQKAEELVASLHCRIGAVMVNVPGFPVSMMVRFPPDRTIEDAIDQFKKSGKVDAAGPNSLLSILR